MKKAFKLLALLLVVTMLFSTLASCSTGGGSDTDTPSAVTGTTEGSTYKNEYFDLSLTLPAHWLFEDKDHLSENPYLFFSKRTDEEKKASDFSLECRAVNEVTADAIEISIEKLDSKYTRGGSWNFSNWSTGSGRFHNRPDYIETAGEISGEIAGEQYNGWNYTITNDGNLAGRSAIFFKKVNDYIIAISILSDGYFGEDAPSNKNNAIGRMTDWFGKAKAPATSMNAEGGGYYLNDIMAPHWESDMLYAQYRRNDPFTIAGETFYDCIPLDNGNSTGAGKTKDVVYYLDGKTYKKFSFTTGVIDEQITVNTSPDQYVAFEILLDGKQVFEERQYAFAKAQAFQVDITGAKKMVIRVRNNWELTSCVIADPVISTSPRNIEKEIQKVSGTVDFLDAAVTFYQGQRTEILYGTQTKTFNVAGKDYQKGMILTDAFGTEDRTYFNLGGKYEQFNFSTGIIQDTRYPGNGWLNIYLDGVKILDVELEHDMPSVNYSLDVSGGHILCIESTANASNAFHQGDYAIYNMTLGAPVIEEPETVEPGSYKLISEIGVPISTKAT
ncbi:MAG: hypothetical protein E7620_05980, partial [Ruminococcaceae bacterium]|nr:hypothetical protein [Oscillospiraceae bacterium]